MGSRVLPKDFQDIHNAILHTFAKRQWNSNYLNNPKHPDHDNKWKCSTLIKSINTTPTNRIKTKNYLFWTATSCYNKMLFISNFINNKQFKEVATIKV